MSYQSQQTLNLTGRRRNEASSAALPALPALRTGYQ